MAPLRDYFIEHVARGEFTVGDIAERLEWRRGPTSRHRDGLDVTRVRRMLGIIGYSAITKPNGRRYFSPPREFVNYDTAVLLCRAMHADPVDFDL